MAGLPKILKEPGIRVGTRRSSDADFWPVEVSPSNTASESDYLSIPKQAKKTLSDQ
jgi:hypothetical protein